MKRSLYSTVSIWTMLLLPVCRAEARPQSVQPQTWTVSGSIGGATLVASYIGQHELERIGYCVAGFGDINGDGFDDFGIGAYHHTTKPGDGDYSDMGGVYIILGKAGVFEFNFSLSNYAPCIIGKYRYDALGYSVGNHGDANGDGLADVLIGACQTPENPTRHPLYPNLPGRVYLVLGKTSINWSKDYVADDNADASFIGNVNNGSLGRSVDFIGDLDGDGCDEFLMAAPRAGKVYLFKGKHSGWQRNTSTATADAIFVGHSVPGGEPGYSVKGLGDINGDGVPDFAIGTMTEDYGGAGPYQPGRMYVFFGRRQINWGQSFDINAADAIYVEEKYQLFGTAHSIGPAGDVNGDGFRDVLASSPRFPSIFSSDPAYNRGKAYLILGRPANQWNKNYLMNESQASYVGSANDDWAGFGSVTTCGDFNNDGYDDFLIGVIQGNPNTLPGSPVNGPGKVYMIKGKATGWANGVNLSGITDVTSGEFTGDGFGWSVSSIGDFNRDGGMDFVVSAPFFRNINFAHPIGKVYVYLGDKKGFMIKGSVTYWNGGKPVTGATVRKDGTGVTTTSYQGMYFLPVNPGTSCTVSIVKSNGVDVGDTTVSSYDAALTARGALGLDVLDANQRKTADINGDGKIWMDDAFGIARYAVGLEGTGTVRAGDWFFEPAERAYTNVQSDLPGQNYTAYVRGDVDGGWKGGVLKRSDALSGVLEKRIFWENDTLNVNFLLNRSVPLISFDLSMGFEPGTLAYVGYTPGQHGKHFNLVDCARQGSVKLGGFTVEDARVEGEFITLKFTADPGMSHATRLQLKKAQLNRDVVERNAELAVGESVSADGFGLLRNYPNPFNSRTVVEYLLTGEGSVRLDVVDVQGKSIRILESGNRPAGRHRVEWDGLDRRGAAASSGVYVIRLTQGTSLRNIKILLLR